MVFHYLKNQICIYGENTEIVGYCTEMREIHSSRYRLEDTSDFLLLLPFFLHLGLSFVDMGISFSLCCLLAGSSLYYILYYTVANLQSYLM